MTELGASAIAKVEVEFDREAGSVRLATSSSHCIASVHKNRSTRP